MNAMRERLLERRRNLQPKVEQQIKEQNTEEIQVLATKPGLFESKPSTSNSDPSNAKKVTDSVSDIVKAALENSKNLDPKPKSSQFASTKSKEPEIISLDKEH